MATPQAIEAITSIKVGSVLSRAPGVRSEVAFVLSTFGLVAYAAVATKNSTQPF